MKRIRFLLFIILFIFLPVKIYAASTPRVLTLEGSASGSTISYNGTIEDGSTAVMCKLLSTSSLELDMLSSPVDNGAFVGEFVVSENKDYKIACANYDSGEIKEITVSFNKNTSSSNTSKNDKLKVTDSKNVKTSDNIMRFIIAGSISLIGIVILFIIKRKRV